MKATVLTFGIARELLNGTSVQVALQDGATVSELKRKLVAQYPGMKQLDVCMIAVNSEYAEDDQLLHESDEIALIPPVSGG